jgi:template-activating factor I
MNSERHAQVKLASVYEKRRQVIQTIPNFWPIALMNHSMFAYHAQHNSDQSALVYLEDLWVARDLDEPRCFTIEFVRFRCSLHHYDISTCT